MRHAPAGRRFVALASSALALACSDDLPPDVLHVLPTTKTIATGDTPPIGGIERFLGRAADDLWLRTADGNLRHWNGTAWKKAGAMDKSLLTRTGTLAPAGPGRLWVLNGEELALLGRDGSKTSAPLPPEALQHGAELAATADTLYLKTADASNLPVLEAWNGTAWATLELPKVGVLDGLRGFPSGELLATFSIVDRPSVLGRWDGTAWSTVTTTRPGLKIDDLVHVGGNVCALSPMSVEWPTSSPGDSSTVHAKPVPGSVGCWQDGAWKEAAIAPPAGYSESNMHVFHEHRLVPLADGRVGVLVQETQLGTTPSENQLIVDQDLFAADAVENGSVTRVEHLALVNPGCDFSCAGTATVWGLDDGAVVVRYATDIDPVGTLVVGRP